MNDRIERFTKLKSFLGGILSSTNIIPSDFVDISARTELDGCTLRICLGWDGVGKLSVRSQEALAELRVLTEGGEVEGEMTRLFIQTKSLRGDWQTVATFTDEAEAKGALQHVFVDFSDSVRLVTKAADGGVRVLDGTGDTR